MYNPGELHPFSTPVLVQSAEPGEKTTPHELAFIVAEALGNEFVKAYLHMGHRVSVTRVTVPVEKTDTRLVRREQVLLSPDSKSIEAIEEQERVLIVPRCVVPMLSQALAFWGDANLWGLREPGWQWYTFTIPGPIRWEGELVDVSLCGVSLMREDREIIDRIARALVSFGVAPPRLTELLSAEEKNPDESIQVVETYFYWKPPSYNGLLFLNFDPRATNRSDALYPVLYGRYLYSTGIILRRPVTLKSIL